MDIKQLSATPAVKKMKSRPITPVGDIDAYFLSDDDEEIDSVDQPIPDARKVLSIHDLIIHVVYY